MMEIILAYCDTYDAGSMEVQTRLHESSGEIFNEKHSRWVSNIRLQIS